MRLLPPNSSRSARNLFIARGRSCDEASVELGCLIATNAIASAANKSVLTVAKRTAEAKRFRVKECGVFIFIETEFSWSFNERESVTVPSKDKSATTLTLPFCNREAAPAWPRTDNAREQVILLLNCSMIFHSGRS